MPTEESKTEEAQATPAAPVTAAVIRDDLVAELELLGDRAKGKIVAYTRRSLSFLGNVLDELDGDDKPPAKDAPSKKEA